MRRRYVCLVTGLITYSLFLSACGTAPDLEINDNKTLLSKNREPQNDMQIQINLMGGIDPHNKLETDAIKMLIAEYEVLNPNVNIKAEKWPVSDSLMVNNYLQERMLSKKGPDLYLLNSMQTNKQISQNWWTPLNKLLDQPNPHNHGDLWKNSFFEETIQQSKHTDGEQYAINYGGMEVGLFYNKEKVKQTLHVEPSKYTDLAHFFGSVMKTADLVNKLGQDPEDKESFIKGKRAVFWDTDNLADELNNLDLAFDWGELRMTQEQANPNSRILNRYIALNGLSLAIPKYLKLDPIKQKWVIDFLMYISTKEAMHKFLSKTNYSISFVKDLESTNFVPLMNHKDTRIVLVPYDTWSMIK